MSRAISSRSPTEWCFSSVPPELANVSQVLGFGRAGFLRKIAFPSAQILEWAGGEVEVVQECSAVDGTWGMKAQYYEIGRRYAQKLVRGFRDSEARLYVSDCPLSALRISREVGVRCMHPIEVLAMAYGIRPEGVEQGETESRA